MTEEILSLANALNDSIKVIKNDLDFTLAVIKDLDENKYEGDILRGDYYPLSDGDIKDNYLLVVEWSDNGAYFTANSYKRNGSTVQGISAGFENEITAEVVKQLEIAGNVYDNADMLYGWEE